MDGDQIVDRRVGGDDDCAATDGRAARCAALAPRSVALEGLVDGRNRSVSAADASQELRVVLSAYKREPSRLTIRDRAAESGLATWIAAELLR